MLAIPGTGSEEHLVDNIAAGALRLTEVDLAELSAQPEPLPDRRPCDAGPVIVAFVAELWIWQARRDGGWTFVSLPAEASEEIRDRAAGRRRGFGPVRVRATVGGSTWTTSIFPDSARNAYVLPVKAGIRKAEGLEAGDVATVSVELIDD